MGTGFRNVSCSCASPGRLSVGPDVHTDHRENADLYAPHSDVVEGSRLLLQNTHIGHMDAVSQSDYN